jgi:HSP90 family molecular chaperone
MDIIINSLYSEKDVFLRELVSNAADACDKKRFLTLTEGKGQEDALEIRIKADKEAKTLTIEDVGVGMSKEELVNNLGKIAQSGTKQFAEAMKAKESGNNDVNLIGQFGVGFYSGFLVADKITVITKGFNDASGKTYKWESEAGSSFTITELENSDEIQAASGSKLILSLREDAEEVSARPRAPRAEHSTRRPLL